MQHLNMSPSVGPVPSHHHHNVCRIVSVKNGQRVGHPATKVGLIAAECSACASENSMRSMHIALYTVGLYG